MMVINLRSNYQKCTFKDTEEKLSSETMFHDWLGLLSLGWGSCCLTAIILWISLLCLFLYFFPDELRRNSFGDHSNSWLKAISINTHLAIAPQTASELDLVPFSSSKSRHKSCPELTVLHISHVLHVHTHTHSELNISDAKPNDCGLDYTNDSFFFFL